MNLSLIKYGLVLATMPIWLPFARQLWQALKDCLAEDGGFFGSEPGPSQLEELRRQREEAGDPLIHEPFQSNRRVGFPGTRRGAPGGARAQVRRRS